MCSGLNDMIGQWIGTGLDIMMVLGGRIGNKKGIRLQIGIEMLISVKSGFR